MVRASTEAQQIEDQHREMVQFCLQEGYKEKDIIFVEDKGASAIKLNDSYNLMINQVKESISSDPEINCFAVWELSRAFRNELVFQEVKQILLEKKIQFLVRTPSLRLLNADGTINAGMELAMSMYATLSKQEMELKKERFNRAKKALRKQGKFIGGRCVKFGYKIINKNEIVEKEEDARLVRLVFEMYSTGKYSIRTLYDELSERGYKIKYSTINWMLADSTYIDGIIPPIISKELWYKCKEVREHNFLSIPKGKKYVFGAGIFICKECGRRMIAEGVQYRCWHHNKHSAPPHCTSGLTIRVENMDALLWWVASKEEIKYQMHLDQSKKEEYQEKIEILDQKIITLKSKLDTFEFKKSKIVDTYLEDLITKQERDKKLNKLKEENLEYQNTILSYREQIKSLKNLLNSEDKDRIDMDYLTSLYTGVIKEKDLKIMSEIVHRHISKVTSEPYWFGKDRDKRAIRKNAQLITIYTVTGSIQKYIYVARKYKGHYFFFNNGKETPILNIHKIKREPEKSLEKRAFKKLSNW